LYADLRPSSPRRRSVLKVPDAQATSDWQIDLEFQLQVDGDSWPIYAVVKRRMPSSGEIIELRHMADASRRREPKAILCLVTPRLLQRHRRALREAGISHADFRGVLYLRGPGLVIDVDSRDAEAGDAATEDLGGVEPSEYAANPFVDRTSLILRALFEQPHTALRLATLAELTGVSVGWASIVGRELEQREYAVRTSGGLRIENPARMLRDWVRAYSWRQNSIRRFEVPFDNDAVLAKLRKLTTREAAGAPSSALTLHSAANLIAPHVEGGVVTLYATGSSQQRLLRWVTDTLYGEPVTTGGKLHLVKPFYEHSALFGARTVQGLPSVSLLQLFLDLAHYPLRGAEAAALLARTALNDHLGLTPTARKELLAELS
jgi:hypothetical protein